MPTSSSIKLLNTVEWAKKLTFNRSLAIGDYLEPAISSANTVMQTIVGAPFAWRWNRSVTGFITKAGQQDYTLFNWTAGAPVQLLWQTVDTYGNAQVLTTAGVTGSLMPAWNNTLSGTTKDGTAVWTNLGSIGTPVSSTYGLAWIETASVYDTSTSKWMQIQPELCLAQDSTSARPRNIAAQGDDNRGNLTFRLMPTPDLAYPVSITVQAKPPLFTSVNQTWAPIPDEYSHVFNWGFLALMWLFTDDPRFAFANQKFITQLLGSNQGLTQTQMNIFLNNWQAITGQGVANLSAQQQGFQSRGV